jgi:site-specific DNA recombinase
MVKSSKPIAAYMRVSRVGDREERLRSPDLQRGTIERFASQEGLTVEWFPAELDVSGSKAKRPVLDQIMERVKLGELGGIVVAKLDRLSRMRPKERVLLFEEVEDAGGLVLSASEQLDPSTPEGRFARDVFLGVARMQWERYREGFETAKENAIADGIPVATRPAVGYRRLGRRLVPDEYAAPLVRQVFERRAQGEGPVALGNFLQVNNVKTSQGSTVWSKQAIYGMIRNRVYLGELSYGKDARFVNQAAHEPVVDLATWTAAQHPNGRLTPSRSKDGYLLAGIVRCAACRHCLQGTTTSRGKRVYRCTRRHAGGMCPEPVTNVPADLLEDAAVKMFWKITRDLEAKGTRDDSGDLAALEAELDKASTMFRQLLSPEVQDAIGDTPEFAVRLREAREARDKAADTLGKARAVRTDDVPDTETLRAAWERMTTQERRELLGLRLHCLALRRDRRLVVYPVGVDVGELPRRGFKTAPEIVPFADPPRGTRTVRL